MLCASSVDDESFLNICEINEGTFDDFDANTMDDELGSEDELGELPKKKGSRGVNFTIDEDETLVRAWEAIALDPITGDEQPGATYWKRIHDHFQRNNKSGVFRSQISLTHRWQTIQTSCSKWA